MKNIRKKLFLCVGFFGFFAMSTPLYADLCYNCGSGSSNGCNQCRARGGTDTSEARKACKELGCNITGTSSCSTAANVKVCRAPSLKDGITSASQCSPFYPF